MNHRIALFLLLSLLSICSVTLGQSAGLTWLSGAAIRTTIIGKTITDDAHWADRFEPDGRLSGHDMGREYVGHWKIVENELCLTHQAKHPVTECYEVWIKGNQVEYRRDGVTIAEAMIR